MKRWLIMLLLVSLGLNLGLGLGMLRRDQGAPPPPPAGGPREGFEAGPPPELAQRFMRQRIEHMTRELDLDEEQQRALGAIYQRSSEELFAGRQEMRAVRERIRQLVAAPDTRWDVVQTVLAEQSRQQAVLDSLVVRTMFEERQLLDGEQLARYEQFILPMGGHRGRDVGPGARRGERGRGGRPGGRGDGPRQRP